jgi:probable blue pigment (indigoidine) exporter
MSRLSGGGGHPAAPTPAVAAAVMATIVVIWGLGPPVTKLITAPPLVAVSVRFWVTMPVVWAILLLTKRRVPREVLRRTALAGTLFGINLVFVFAALQHASVAVLAVISSMQPGVVLVVAGPWLGERATPWHLAWTAAGVVGVAVVVLGGNDEVRGDALGYVYGVASMLTFTGYSLINRRVRFGTSIDPVQWMAGITLFALVTITPVALYVSSPDDYRQLAGADWLYLAFVAGIVGVVSHTMMSWVHKFVPASRSSLFLLGAKVVAISAAWPLHDEPVTLVQVLGALIVIAAVTAVISRPASVRIVATLTPAPARP